MRYYALDLQPEPWTAPSVSVGKKGGRAFPRVYQSAAVKSYKEAVAEELTGLEPVMEEGLVSLRFYFWRALPVYVSEEGSRVRKHKPDVTNLQKLLEDACQGILYANDRDVRDIQSVLMAMEQNTKPMVVIGIAPFVMPDVNLPAPRPKPVPVESQPFDIEAMF